MAKQVFKVTPSERNFKWKGVATKVYKTDGTGFKDIIRREIIGEKQKGTPIQVRYFEIGKGGYSSLEEHHHVHAVVVIRGRGKALVGNKAYKLKPLDSIYIGPKTAHQFHQVGKEPFGFLCMVTTKRDRPKLITGKKAETLKRRKKLKGVVKT